MDGAKDLRKMLEVAGLPEKPSYNPGEVCRLLNMSYDTYHRMVKGYEEIDGRPKAGTLRSFRIRGESRVYYHELVRYLEANDSYARLAERPLPGQQRLF